MATFSVMTLPCHIAIRQIIAMNDSCICYQLQRSNTTVAICEVVRHESTLWMLHDSPFVGRSRARFRVPPWVSNTIARDHLAQHRRRPCELRAVV